MAQGLVMSNDIHAINAEASEGVYDDPQSASDGYVEVLEPGIEIKTTIEQVERKIIVGALGKAKPRNGIQFPVATIGMEVKGSGTEGTAPQHGVLFESLLGTKTTIATTTTTKSSGNTSSNLKIEDADISKFAVNDIVIVKQSGAHQFVAITAIVTTPGSANIEVYPARIGGGSFSNSVVISKSTTYKPANTGHPTFSVTRWLGAVIRKNAMGLRCKSMSLDDFSTGKIPTTKFEAEGLTFDQSVDAPNHTPSYDTALPPIVLSADVFLDGVEVNVNEVQLKFDTGVGFLPSTGSATGRVTGRANSLTITGTLSPYKEDDDVDLWTKLTAETNFSLLLTCGNPSGSAGEREMGSCFAIWLPQVKLTDKPEDQLEGVHRDVLTFMAHRGNLGQTPEVSIAFI